MIVTRNGKLIYQKTYQHDYDRIYGDSARSKSALNPHNPGGPYNYYNPWWHPYYRRLGFKKGQFPQAERFYDEALTIPLYFDLTEADQDKVVAAIRRAVSAAPAAGR